MLTHREALRIDGSGTSRPDLQYVCDGKLVREGEHYSLDIFWEDYRCQKCGKLIATIDGHAAQYNHEVNEVAAN